MSIVAIVKQSDLLRGGIVQVLEKKIPACTVNVYDENQHHLLYEDDHSFDILIIDVDMNINFWNLIDFSLNKKVKIAVWTNQKSDKKLKKLFLLGLDGYLYYEMETNELIYSIRCMMDGSQFIDPRLASFLLDNYKKVASTEPLRPSGMLTDREWEVLELIVQGKKNDMIGDQLFISYKTVTNHVASIFRKLQVTDRTSAAILAVKEKWIIL